MSNDRATAMTDALDVAQKIVTVCRRRSIDIPRFEVQASIFANAEAELTVQWMDPERSDISLIGAVFDVTFGETVTQGQSAWVNATDMVDGIDVTYTIFTQ